EIVDTRGSVSFNSATTITNGINTINGATINSVFPGIDIRQNTASIFFNSAVINGATGPAAPGFGGVGVNIGGFKANDADANPGLVTFSSLNIVSTGGTGLYANSVGVPSSATTGLPTGGLVINAINSNNVTTTNGTAVDIENAVLNATFRSVTSVNATV